MQKAIDIAGVFTGNPPSTVGKYGRVISTILMAFSILSGAFVYSGCDCSREKFINPQTGQEEEGACGQIRRVEDTSGTPQPASASRNPIVAMDDNGRALILYRGRTNEDPQNPTHPQALVYQFGTGLNPTPVDLAGVTPQNFVTDRGQLVWDESGIATALWLTRNTQTGAVELYANQFIVGGWGPRTLVTSVNGSITDYRIAMGGNGGYLVLWVLQTGEVFSREFTQAAGFETERTVPFPTGEIRSLVFGPSRRGYLGWSNPTPAGTVFDVFVSQVTAVNGWNPPVRIGSGNSDSPRLSNSRQAFGELAIAVWEGSDGIYYNRASTGVWGFLNGDKIPGSDFRSGPQVAMAANGEAIATWSGGMSSQFVSGVWGPVQSGALGRVVTDALGNAIALGSTGSTVIAARYIRGVGWEPAVTIGTNLITNGQPDIAMDSSGRALAVWEALDPANSSKTRVEVYEFGGFDLAPVSVPPVTLLRSNNQVSTMLTVNRSDYAGPVTFSVMDCPANVTCGITPNVVQGAQTDAVVSFSTGAVSATPGNFVVTIQATGGGVSRTRFVEAQIS